jgi:hypothetical protein
MDHLDKGKLSQKDCRQKPSAHGNLRALAGAQLNGHIGYKP